MKTSFPHLGEVFVSVLSTLWIRVICFFLAMFIGMNLAALYQKHELVWTSTFTFFAFAATFGWLVSVRIFFVDLATLIALFVILKAESHVVVALALLAVCAIWCYAGLML